MFLNLYYLRDPSFRNHNFSDFWNESGGGDPIELVTEEDIKRHLRTSYMPDPQRPGRLEGLAPDFDAIFPITFSRASCESFIRSTPLPITPRDYYLAKAFQFLYLAIVMRYWPDAVEVWDPLEVPANWEIRDLLQSALDAIPDEAPTRLCEPPMDWWWSLYDDTLTHDLRTVLDRLPAYLVVLGPPSETFKTSRPTVAPFEMPKGVTWADVTIRFISDHRVQLTVGSKPDTRNYTEMGFEDRRRDLPDRSWQFLRRLALNNGVIQREQQAGEEWTKVEKRIQQIRQRLRAVFNIPGDPFESYQRLREYRAKFRIECAPSYSA